MVTVIASANVWGLFQVVTVICDHHKNVNMTVCEDSSFDVRNGKDYKIKSTFNTWNKTAILDMIFHWLHLKHILYIL